MENLTEDEHFQQQFAINYWCGIGNGTLMRLFEQLTILRGESYLQLLHKHNNSRKLVVLEEVP